MNNVRRANYIFYCFLRREIFLLLIYLADRRRQVVLKAQGGGTSLRQDASSSVSAQRGSIFVDHHLLVRIIIATISNPRH